MIPTLTTERLLLRPHRPDDLEPLHAIWADERVYRGTIGSAPDREACWMRMLRYEGLWSLLGYGYWALEYREDKSYIGNLGFADFHRDMQPGFNGRPEAGWMLQAEQWGKGLAMEAMQAACDWADSNLASPSTVCMISPDNATSHKLAARLGYTRFGESRYKNSNVILYERHPLSPSASATAHPASKAEGG